MLKAALFDLDGVIIDTEGQYFRFWNSIGQELFPEIDGFAHNIKGSTLTAIRSRYFSHDESLANDVERRLAEFEAQMRYELFPGVEDFLSQLHAAGVPCAVVTSSNQQKMKSLAKQLPALTSLFERVFTAEDTGRGKPYPDCYLHAAETMGENPQECAVFEDSVNGLKAGRASGAFVVGLTTTNPHDTVCQFADIVFADLQSCQLQTIQQIMSQR